LALAVISALPVVVWGEKHENILVRVFVYGPAKPVLGCGKSSRISDRSATRKVNHSLRCWYSLLALNGYMILGLATIT